MRISTTLTVLTVGALAVVGLAGCSSSSDDASGTPTVTDTVTAAPQPSSDPSSSTTSTPTAEPTDGATSGTGAGTATNRCASSNLTAAIAQGSGGAAGSVYVNLVLTNTGSVACTLQGWPGVSLVGGGNGTQIGKAADFDRSTSHATVKLAAGGTATAQLKYVQAGNFPEADCQPKKGDGFRVYPPGNTASIFAKDASITGCQKTSESVFTVGALHS